MGFYVLNMQASLYEGIPGDTARFDDVIQYIGFEPTKDPQSRPSDFDIFSQRDYGLKRPSWSAIKASLTVEPRILSDRNAQEESEAERLSDARSRVSADFNTVSRDLQINLLRGVRTPDSIDESFKKRISQYVDFLRYFSTQPKTVEEIERRIGLIFQKCEDGNYSEAASRIPYTEKLIDALHPRKDLPVVHTVRFSVDFGNKMTIPYGSLYIRQRLSTVLPMLALDVKRLRYL